MSSRGVITGQLPDIVIGRFKAKLDIKSDSECWNWTGSLNGKGYGSFNPGKLAPKFPTKIAHRIAYYIEHGNIDLDLLVCHSCDNPSCCNPAHLWQGTVQDNQKDMKDKGRAPRGSKQGMSKLTEADVKAIRTMYKTGRFEQSLIGELFKVSTGNVQHICSNDTWSHINE